MWKLYYPPILILLWWKQCYIFTNNFVRNEKYYGLFETTWCDIFVNILNYPNMIKIKVISCLINVFKISIMFSANILKMLSKPKNRATIWKLPNRRTWQSRPGAFLSRELVFYLTQEHAHIRYIYSVCTLISIDIHHNSSTRSYRQTIHFTVCHFQLVNQECMTISTVVSDQCHVYFI